MKTAIYTLGCKVNQYESEYMAELLQKAGFEIVSANDEADYYIINSCTVTATADQKTRQHVRQFKRKHPSSCIILTGCMPQAFPEEAKALGEADIVISNKSDGDIVSVIKKHEAEKERVIDIDRHCTGDPFAPCSISGFGGRIRAFVKIEDGCDRFCSYCIIPTSRGRVRSKNPEDLTAEVKTLAQNGIKEIVLVGINLSAYGKNENYDIADAVKICSDTDGILRVRLGSLEPDHITDEIIEKLADCEKFCPQFHISLQSGCTKTLKNMNRHYTAEEYEELCTKLRSTFPDASITTDVMVGFHEESEDDFRESLEFVKKIGFEKVHVFPYSERKGTLASRKGDSVSKSVKEKRAAEMISQADALRKEFFKKYLGKSIRVLVENKIGDFLYSGYTENYLPVHIKSDNCKLGQIVSVTVKEIGDDYCIAE